MSTSLKFTTNSRAVVSGVPCAHTNDAPWWGRNATMIACMLLVSMPVWFTSLPPLIDFLGHLGRYRVQLDIAHSPVLQQNWDFRWALIGNLGIDLLIVPLAKLFGLERAGWIVAATLPPLMVWGMFRVARAVHGTVPPTVLAAVPFALAYPYQYGFVNYWLSTALALHVFAAWIRFDAKPATLRVAIFAPLGVIVWVAHVYGWGILGLLIGGYELSRVWRLGNRNAVRIVATAVGRSAPFLLPLALMIVWRDNGEGAVTLGWFRMQWKYVSLSYTLRDQSKLLDIGSLIAAACLIYSGARSRHLGMDGRLGVAAALALALVLIIPYQLFGSAFADARLWPIIFIIALLAITPPRKENDATPGRLAQGLALAAGAILLVRIAFGVAGFARYHDDYQRHLRALDHVERGSSVAILSSFPCNVPWRRPRLDHLGSVALLRREAFVNSQWDVPGAQLLVPLRARGTRFNADPSHFVHTLPGCSADLRTRLGQRIDGLPKDRFDYLWVLGFNPAALPAYPDLRRLYSDDNTILYRIEKNAP